MMWARFELALLCSTLWAFATAAVMNTSAPLPSGGTRPPVPPPAYMVDNTRNFHGVAPDRYQPPAYYQNNLTLVTSNSSSGSSFGADVTTATSYWLANMQHGKQPLAAPGYQVWRNVMDYGATGDGVTDDTIAINNAVSDGDRCGLACGSTTVTPAIVFFPPGTYMISSPIIQYYFTQFIGDPTDLPTIKGMATFQGIALIDTDVYIPGGNGTEWYINQNQFFRQIRNFIIDLTAMPNENQSGDQTYVPTGIHWQVAQATSLQNVQITMTQGSTAVGIFTENGSGGFMSDLTIFGGNIGMRVGSQQFTARDITFTNNAIAVSMIWDWGWTWKNILVQACYIAFQLTNFGGLDDQGTGSLTVIDSHFIDVPYGFPVNPTFVTAITLDNLLVEGNSPQIVFIDGTTDNLLAGVTGGSMVVTSWATGRRYTSLTDPGASATGDISPVVSKAASLLDGSGNWFVQSKPQYETLGAESFLNVLDSGAMGDGNNDDGASLNTAFSQCTADLICFIPHGIYKTSVTLLIPLGARIVGEAWPQIVGFGAAFQDVNNPEPVVQVGQPGDAGVVEISDVLFTASGATPGAVLVEWSVHEASQGSAAMWDSHFRVGGALGTGLDTANCPASGAIYSPACNGASLLMHVAPGASGYFENVWIWTADHYLDDGSQAQLNVMTGRGLLVERSQGPNWFWGGASEHSVLYQYNIWNSSNIFLGHMQTESPYYQPGITSTSIYPANFNGDPAFSDCGDDPTCLMSWALLISGSTNIYIYGAGFYSFYDSFVQPACLAAEDCQLRLMQTEYSEGIWMYSQYTKGATQAISPGGAVTTADQADNRNGYLTAITAWLPLALTGADVGGVVSQADHSPPATVTIDPAIASACGSPTLGATITISSACATAIANLPPSSSANDPPGPEPCTEDCDLLRRLTDTCCSTGFDFPWPVVIPPDVEIPAPINLPQGFSPPIPLTVPVTNTDGTESEDSYPCCVPLPIPVIIPAGLLPAPAGSGPLVIPAGTEVPQDSPAGGGECEEVMTASDCLEYVFPGSPSQTTSYCAQVTGCDVADTTSTTTVSSCALLTAVPSLPSGFALATNGLTVTVAHLTTTLTFTGNQASIWGSTVTVDLGTEGLQPVPTSIPSVPTSISPVPTSISPPPPPPTGADFCFQGWNSADCTGTEIVSDCVSDMPINQCFRVGTSGPFRSIEAQGQSNTYNILLFAGSFDCDSAIAITGSLKQATGCADSRENYDSYMRIA